MNTLHADKIREYLSFEYICKREAAQRTLAYNQLKQKIEARHISEKHDQSLFIQKNTQKICFALIAVSGFASIHLFFSDQPYFMASIARDTSNQFSVIKNCFQIGSLLLLSAGLLGFFGTNRVIETKIAQRDAEMQNSKLYIYLKALTQIEKDTAPETQP